MSGFGGMHPDDREWLEAHEEQEERNRAHDARLAAKDRLREKGEEFDAAMLDVHATDEWDELGSTAEVLHVLTGRRHGRYMVVDELHVWPADSELPRLVSSFPVPEGVIFGSTALDVPEVLDNSAGASLMRRAREAARRWLRA